MAGIVTRFSRTGGLQTPNATLLKLRTRACTGRAAAMFFGPSSPSSLSSPYQCFGFRTATATMAPSGKSKDAGKSAIGGSAELLGTVTKVLYRADMIPSVNTFGVIVMTHQGKDVRVAGPGAGGASVGDTVGVSGKWVSHTRYGLQVKANRLKVAATSGSESGDKADSEKRGRKASGSPPQPASVAAFLASGVLKGVGPATAGKIVEALGAERALATLELSDWSPFLKAKGVGEKALSRMRTSWDASNSNGKLALQLHGLGLPLDVAASASTRLGAAAAADILRGDPYESVGRIAGMSLAAADDVVLRQASSSPPAQEAVDGPPASLDPARVRAALRLALRRCVVGGDTGLSGPALLATALQLLYPKPRGRGVAGGAATRLPSDPSARASLTESLKLPNRLVWGSPHGADLVRALVALAAPETRAVAAAETGADGNAKDGMAHPRAVYASLRAALRTMIDQGDLVWQPDDDVSHSPDVVLSGSAEDAASAIELDLVGPGVADGEVAAEPWWELRGSAFSIGASATENSLAVSLAVLRSRLGRGVAVAAVHGAVGGAGEAGERGTAAPEEAGGASSSDDAGVQELSAEQREAVHAAQREPLTVLCGGPGTGKTFATRAVVLRWLRRGLRVALACPTAKAAIRLNETLAGERGAWQREAEAAAAWLKRHRQATGVTGAGVASLTQEEADAGIAAGHSLGALIGQTFPRAVTLHRLLEFGRRADGADGADANASDSGSSSKGLGAVRLEGFGSAGLAPRLVLPNLAEHSADLEAEEHDADGDRGAAFVDAGAMSLTIDYGRTSAGSATAEGEAEGGAWKAEAELDWDTTGPLPTFGGGRQPNMLEALSKASAASAAKRGRGFQRNALRPLEADAILVDEASMVDSRLAQALFAAIRAPSQHDSAVPGGMPESLGVLGGAPLPPRLMLVGDGDQLPSVGPGRVFADIIDSGCVHVTRLQTVFRQAAASPIVRNAHSIRAGEMPTSFKKWGIAAAMEHGHVAPNDHSIGEDHSGGDGSAADVATGTLPPPPEDLPSASASAAVHPGACVWVDTDSPSLAGQVIAGPVMDLVRNLGFDPHTDCQVLSPMRRGTAGTTGLNDSLRLKLNPGNPTQPAESGGDASDNAGPRLRAGDRVVQRINDYERGVINGDTGVVESVEWRAPTALPGWGRRRAGGHVVRVRFDAAGGLGTGTALPAEPGSAELVAEYTSGEAGKSLELAYAMTVHKAQGSEWPVVVLSMFSHHFPMLSRGLLYTAVSRARKLLVIVGTRSAGHIAVGQDRDQHRCTGLVERIRMACATVDGLLADPESEVSLALANAALVPACEVASVAGDAMRRRTSSTLSHHVEQTQQDRWEGLGVGGVIESEAPTPQRHADSSLLTPSELQTQVAPIQSRLPTRLTPSGLHELWNELRLEEELIKSEFGQALRRV